MERQTPGDLPSEWRRRAQQLRDWGIAEEVARTLELNATELEQALRSFKEEALSLVEAARVSGYSADHLGELVRSGKLPNAGRKNAPRIRRRDLPMKKPRTPSIPKPSPSVPATALEKRIAAGLRSGI